MLISKKDTIIATATQLFAHKSYIYIGVDQIITDSNIAKMTFYYHFKTKEQLILNCLQQLISEVQTSILKRTNEQHPPLAQLNQIYLGYIEWINYNKFSGCPIYKAKIEISKLYPSSQPLLSEYQHWLYQLVYSYLKKLNTYYPEYLTQIFIYILYGTINIETPENTQFDPNKSWLYIQTLIKSNIVKI